MCMWRVCACATVMARRSNRRFNCLGVECVYCVCGVFRGSWKIERVLGLVEIVKYFLIELY